jgi:hypothetical protein
VGALATLAAMTMLFAAPAFAKPKPPPHESARQAAGTWRGTFDVQVFATVPNNACTAAWRGVLSVVVRQNATLQGTGQATTTKPVSCTNGLAGVPPAARAALTVAGRFTGRRFQLRLSGTSIDGFDAGFHVL